MSRMTDYKIVAECLLTGLVMAEACTCRGAVEPCQYCACVRGLEALVCMVGGGAVEQKVYFEDMEWWPEEE